MRRYVTTLYLALVPVALACAGSEEQAEDGWPSPIKVDSETLKVLDKINAVSAYEVPNLGLRQDEDYAKTARDFEPFRHVKPYKEHFLLQMEYTGPGRAIPEPNDIVAVKIGFIGPIMSTVSVATGGKSHEELLGIKMLQGARLAIEQANAKGGYLKRKIPFELVVSNDNGLWGASGNEIIKMAYKDKVWAILGTIDGANSHIAIRVALKAEIPMMNSGDTDPTFVETNIPWVFRCISDDRQQGYLLVDYMYKKLGLKRIGIIRANNRYGRFGVREIRDGSRRLGNPIVLEMSYKLGIEDFSVQLERLKEENLDAVVHWGDAAEGARILNQMRATGMAQPFFACDRCLADEFVEIAGANAEGVICTYPWNPTQTSGRLETFRKAFRQRFGEESETFAAHAYDGMNMLIWAVQVAGLNRAKIRDVLAHRARPWKGVTGDIMLSAVLDDVGDVYLAKRKNGQWDFCSRDELQIPREYVPPRDSSREPFFDARTHQTDYAGPGREKPSALDVNEVVIGYFGPSTDSDPDAGDMWRAASLAVEEANRAGGYKGLPFRLVAGWSDSPWGSGVTAVTRMVYTDNVWAMIGGIDGPSTHLAEQVVAKARLALLSPAGTDKTVNLANVPWMFSCLPGDHLQAPVLAQAIASHVGQRPLLLVSAVDHDSHLFTRELTKFLAQERVTLCHHLEFEPKQRDGAGLAKRIVNTEADTLVLIAAARPSAQLIRAVRERGFNRRIFCGPCVGRRDFLDAAGEAADGIVFPLLYTPGERSERFEKQFTCRFGRRSDYLAAHTYDAVSLLIAAIHQAGLNRARIGDAVRQLSGWCGVTGDITWDPLGANLRPVRLGTLRSGRVQPLPVNVFLSSLGPDP